MECQPGYFGKSCETPCPPGLYGDNCGGHCLRSCPEEECNHIHGCPRSTSLIPQTKNKGLILTTDSDLNKITKSSNVNEVSSERNIMLVTEKAGSHIVISSLHLLSGIGIIISLFLILIVLQFCKRSILIKKRNRENQETDDANKSNEQAGPSSSLSSRSNQTIYNELAKIPGYDPLEAEYSVVNETPIVVCLNTLDRRKGKDTQSMKQYIACKTIGGCGRVNKTSALPNTTLDAEMADTYLNPIVSTDST